MRTESLSEFKSLLRALLALDASDPNEGIPLAEAALSLVHAYVAGQIEWPEFVGEAEGLIGEARDAGQEGTEPKD